MTRPLPARSPVRSVSPLTASPLTKPIEKHSERSWLERSAGELLRAGQTMLRTRATATATPLEEVAMPRTVPGSRTLATPLRVVVCVDESGSTSTSDPDRATHRAVLHVCDWLRDQSQDPRDRVGVVRFAERAATIRPVRAMRARTVIGAWLCHDPRIGGGTQLTPALEATSALLGRGRGERRVALLLTDGQTSESAETLREQFGRLCETADAVYLLALDADHGWATTGHLYGSLGLTAITPINDRNRGQVAAIIATQLAHEAGLETR